MYCVFTHMFNLAPLLVIFLSIRDLRQLLLHSQYGTLLIFLYQHDSTWSRIITSHFRSNRTRVYHHPRSAESYSVINDQFRDLIFLTHQPVLSVLVLRVSLALAHYRQSIQRGIFASDLLLHQMCLTSPINKYFSKGSIFFLVTTFDSLIGLCSWNL